MQYGFASMNRSVASVYGFSPELCRISISVPWTSTSTDKVLWYRIETTCRCAQPARRGRTGGAATTTVVVRFRRFDQVQRLASRLTEQLDRSRARLKRARAKHAKKNGGAGAGAATPPPKSARAESAGAEAAASPDSEKVVSSTTGSSSSGSKSLPSRSAHRRAVSSPAAPTSATQRGLDASRDSTAASPLGTPSKSRFPLAWLNSTARCPLDDALPVPPSKSLMESLGMQTLDREKLKTRRQGIAAYLVALTKSRAVAHCADAWRETLTFFGFSEEDSRQRAEAAQRDAARHGRTELLLVGSVDQLENALCLRRAAAEQERRVRIAAAKEEEEGGGGGDGGNSGNDAVAVGGGILTTRVVAVNGERIDDAALWPEVRELVRGALQPVLVEVLTKVEVVTEAAAAREAAASSSSALPSSSAAASTSTSTATVVAATSSSSTAAAAEAAEEDNAEEGVAKALFGAVPLSGSGGETGEEDAAAAAFPGEISVEFLDGPLGLRLQPDRQVSGGDGFGARVAAVTPGSQAALCGKIEVGDTVSAVNDWRIGVGPGVEGILPGAPETSYIDVLEKIRNVGRPMRLSFFSWRQRQRFDRLLNLLIELAGGEELRSSSPPPLRSRSVSSGGGASRAFGRARSVSSFQQLADGSAVHQQQIGTAEITTLLQLVGRADDGLRGWYWSADRKDANAADNPSANGFGPESGAGTGVSWHHIASALRGDDRRTSSLLSESSGTGIVAPIGVACERSENDSPTVDRARRGGGGGATARIALPRQLAVRWACTACGYKNREAEVVCGVCDTRAPDASRRSFEPWSSASVGPPLRPLL